MGIFIRSHWLPTDTSIQMRFRKNETISELDTTTGLQASHELFKHYEECILSDLQSLAVLGLAVKKQEAKTTVA